MLCSASVYIIRLCILILCTSHFNDAGSVIWIDNIHGNTTRYRRQATTDCKYKFQCGSGECINEEFECDGTEHCRDGSDENNCKGILCPRNFFKCDYGACISKKSTCDGKPDCKDNSDESPSKCNTKPKPAVIPAPVSGNCSPIQFACDSGNCIDDSLLCDGKVDCPDASDETEKQCAGFLCPKITYKCRYGACISKTGRCNNIRDCIDGSDEDGCPNRPVTPPKPPVKPPIIAPPPPVIPSVGQPGSCLMPNNPPNGEYTIGNAAVGTFKPGSYVSPYSPIRVICIRDHKPSPPDKPVALCVNGEWSSEPAKCSLSCPGTISTKTTNFTCVFNGRPMSSCQDPVEGTVATITCALFHEESSVKQNPFRICRDGSWDRPFPQCYPVCGNKHPRGVPNIIGGKKAEIGDYPWHIGIYNAADKRHLCGGSILNTRVIISAAHCFTDLSTGEKYPKENYLIAAGKYYRIYNDSRDQFEQHRDIEDIHIPPRYKGDVSQYEGDIALVILTVKLELSTAVQPVCIDWYTAFEYEQISGTRKGIVVGWGQTVEGDKPSEELKELNIPVIPYDRCYDQVPKAFRRFLTHDKVCAGFLGNATAACQGDSGGGLTFPDSSERYYIRGIVSTSPSTVDGTCDADQYATYTLVSKHIDFVKLYGL